MENNKALVIPEDVQKELMTKEIVEAKLQEAATECLSLKLVDPNDKKGYAVIEEKRKMLKKTRVLLEKVFKAHRDKVNIAIKQNKEAENHFVGIITPAETHLEAQAKIYQDEQERIKQAELKRLEDEEKQKQEAIRKQEELRQKKIQARQQTMNKLGAILEEHIVGETVEESFDTECYELGEVLVQEQYVLVCTDEEFDAVVKKFEEEKAKIKKIDDRKKAIIKTGAILNNDPDHAAFYFLGNTKVYEKLLFGMGEEMFHTCLREFSVEAEKIKLEKEKETKATEAQKSRLEELRSNGLLSFIREDISTLGKMEDVGYALLLSESKEAKRLQDEHVAKEKEEAENKSKQAIEELEKSKSELARQKLIITRKEAIMSTGAMLHSDGFYKIGKCELKNDVIGSLTDEEFDEIFTSFEAQQQEIQKQKEQEEKAVKEKLIEKGSHRYNLIHKMGYDKPAAFAHETEYLKLSEYTDAAWLALYEAWKQKAKQVKEEAEKKAAELRPDKEKLTTLATQLEGFELPQLTTEEGQEICKGIHAALIEMAESLKTKINNL